jgi:hypothetical protein
MLSTEFQERSINLRFLLDQWFKWLTFFYTLNMLGWGWFVSQIATAQPSPRSVRTALLVSIFFIVEILINAVAARFFLRFLKASRERMEWLATKLSDTDSVESRVQSPFPFQLAERVIWILLAGMLPLIGLWVFIPILMSIAAKAPLMHP